jgi:tetratricopeptide (TPR) repeat protein
MVKKNSDETIPVKSTKTTAAAQPISNNENSGEQVITTPAKRKSRKKTESSELLSPELNGEASEKTVPIPVKRKSTKIQEPKSDLDQTIPVPVKRKNSKKQELVDESIEQILATPAKQNDRKAQESVVEDIQSVPEAEEPTKRKKRGKWIALGILAMILIAAIGAAIGFASAIQARKTAETNQLLIVSTTQYELSLQDINNGNLNMAKRRLEYVIEVYPKYPGAADKLAEVMVKLAQTNQNQNTSTVTISTPVVEATKDTRGASAIFTTAQQQLAAQDWPGLYTSILSLRDLDPTYEAVKVDGMYYMALRNIGISNIKSGNLEIGIFQFSVAERIAPIDSEANNWRQLAIYYVDGGAAWGVNWPVVLQNFSLLYQNAPYLIDANNISSTQRYAQALDGYGDSLQSTGDYCGAVTQYGLSLTIQSSDTVTAKIPQAQEYCTNPPATPTPTVDPNIMPTPTNG